MATSPLSERKFWSAFSACWIIGVILQAQVVYNLGFSFQTAILDSLISIGTLSLGCLFMVGSLRYYFPENNRYIYLLAWSILLAGIWSLFLKWVLLKPLGQVPGYSDFVLHSLTLRFCIGLLVTGAVALASLLYYSQQDQKDLEKRRSESEKMTRDAELYKLRQQLQPHFLFNSLNSINALIGSRPEQARHMVQQLSDFLRAVLKREENQWVTLGEELQSLQLYLDIEKVRFGHRLDATITCEESTPQMKIPAMILQPLVENAIKFGLYDTTEAIHIPVHASTEKGLLLVSVQNPYDPTTHIPKTGTGFGLSSVRRRLYLLFARNDLLETSTDQQIFKASVKIPQPS